MVSFEALGDVGQSHSKGLHSREGILEIQDVGIAIDSAKLHHLWRSKLVSSTYGQSLIPLFTF